MYQNAANSGDREGSEWLLQRRPCQCVLGQASRAFSSMSIVAPNCCQRAVLHKGSICTPPGGMLILLSRVCLLVSMSIWNSMSSLSQALAGEIRREPVHAEGEREFAAVVQVVLHHMPDDPGARQVDWFAVPVVGEGLSHLVGTPAGQAIRYELPGAVEGLHHLGGGWNGRPQLQRNLVPTRIHLHLRAFVLSQELGEPVGTAADDVQGILADGAQVRCGAQLKLLGGERRERPCDVILVRFPGGVERRECEVVFSHRVCSFLLLFS